MCSILIRIDDRRIESRRRLRRFLTEEKEKQYRKKKKKGEISPMLKVFSFDGATGGRGRVRNAGSGAKMTGMVG